MSRRGPEVREAAPDLHAVVRVHEYGLRGTREAGLLHRREPDRALDVVRRVRCEGRHDERPPPENLDANVRLPLPYADHRARRR